MVSTSFIFLRNLAGSISSAGPILNNVNANGLPFLTFLLSNDDVVFDPTAPPSSLHRKGQRGSSPWTSNYQDEDDSIFYLDLPWGPPIIVKWTVGDRFAALTATRRALLDALSNVPMTFTLFHYDRPCTNVLKCADGAIDYQGALWISLSSS